MNDEPLTAQDRLDVMDLIARYCRCIDGGEVEGYAANFAPDGVIEGDAGRAVGHAEIRALIERLFAGGRVGGEPARTRHFVALPYIEALAPEGSTQRCSARTYVIIFTQAETGGPVATPAVGSYTDTCVKLDGRWLFQKRIIAADLGRFGS